MLKKHSLLSVFALTLCINQAMAAVSASAAAQLGTTLMPLGGEMAGNAAGTIPAWTGGLKTAPAGYKAGQHHIDPYPDDKPLFTITNANLNQYKNNLSDGQIALFNSYPETYQIPVYPTRRSAAAPQWVYDNSKYNALNAQLDNSGNSFSNAKGGIPFPITDNAVEMLWNHIARYRGVYGVRNAAEAVVQRGGSYALVSAQQEILFKFYENQGQTQNADNMLFYYLSFVKSPARLAGGAVLVHETLDQTQNMRQAWAYNAGQRRVRRAPNLSYDAPIAASEGIRTADSTDIYNGSPDRYQWTLIGKKEIYIPYNNYKITHPSLSYKALLQPGHINPAVTRNELHRVWVVEGKLRSGARHVYSKRRFYLDEDSWQIVLADEFDSRGELWKVSMAYLKSYYELPAIWTALDVFYDLQGRRYHVQNLDNEEAGTIDFSKQAPDDSYFKPAALRRRGVR
ncbi:MAG: DUF1329 domain-containing protein [Gammaproteobacteria bacterium]|nr:DUF1329 domain-containing protein [Gammaproteobacteria bacterium]